jgi:type 2 lantibiotic biosynthesis protein LanM
MKPSNFENPAWLKALALGERMPSLHQVSTESVDWDPGLASRRLDRWRKHAAFSNEPTFLKKLQAAGLTEDQFSRLLGESIGSLRNRIAIPSWAADIEQAFTEAQKGSANGDAIFQTDDDLRYGTIVAFEPLILQGLRRLRGGLEELGESQTQPIFDPHSVENLALPGLLGRLAGLIARTMVLEINVARLRGDLTGDTPQARFKDFIQRLRRPEICLSLLSEYPVLARRIIESVRRWEESTLECLAHLCKDWRLIVDSLSPGRDPGRLVEMSSGMGDTHRGGRSVTVLGFDSGFKLVYKPHSLAVDKHFSDLLTWLNNRRGGHRSFRPISVLDRGTHGWVEFIKAEGCGSIEEVYRFYERVGGYLALFYVLEATDFHFENLIAAGEHPVPIDLEALFHPRINGRDFEDKGLALTFDSLSRSVLRIGLLPERIWVKEEYAGIDLSAVGGTAGQLTPQPVPVFEEAGTDEVKLVRKRMEMPGSQNRPTLGEDEVKTTDFTDAIVSGFRDLYRQMIDHRDELLDKGGPVMKFAEDEVRAVLRATRTYAILLSESSHPDVLHDAVDADRLFDQLWKMTESNVGFSRVIPFEQSDLRRGDVPVFCTRPSSRDLWSSNYEHLEAFFEEPSLVSVRNCLERLSEDDLARQVWFIQASMASLTMGEVFKLPREENSMAGAGARVSTGAFSGPPPDRKPEREELIAAAKAVADRLSCLALRDGDNVAWLGLKLINEKIWKLLPLTADLYDGTPGIALFMAYIGALTGERRYTELARQIAASLRRLWGQAKPEGLLHNIGLGFGGLGGDIYLLSHLGALWNDPSCFEDAAALIEVVEECISKDESLDIIGGLAGAVMGLLSLHSVTANDRAIDCAGRCGDRLIARASRQQQGLAWTSQIKVSGPLAGFSHGASGIGFALLELSRVSGEARFRDVAIEAIAYERSIFSPETGNWPDFRDLAMDAEKRKESDSPNYQTTWCHGAPGIGLARLRTLAQVDTPIIRDDIKMALQTTLKKGFGSNLSLCHGDLGNLDSLLEASRILDEPQWADNVQLLTQNVLETIKQHGWLCGVPSGVETPGLMVGLAGIGYGLLRLADPDRMPSVLLLDPPRV